ncbi:hypothetical protein [Paenibacillus alvei]|uniref:hypothetical protein n=1 Tax=Paenibacillus alvei TaxID=44250 RepID=UPI0018CCEDD1|nr:hypothetical protein [Paenibacillus alvei]MBG9737096.1 hypothetical protein [Paenibacillus alvei]MBG9742794.1 hypothetical protein [Paenibacillus alvei]MBG9746189.1 hypothetical protein [Paenibacillus alvei]MCY9579703.1 hypothetical protein [Paenibacillus alvei]MCY9586356.1 hypothetical protein [Paenibacillus alvei]
MAKVIAPNKEYTGISAGVTFANGVGETDNPHLLEWFESKGYEVENDPVIEEDNQPDGSPSPDSNVHTDDGDQAEDKTAEKPLKATKAGK